MTRTPEQVFADHAGAVGRRDLDAVVAGYTADAAYIDTTGSHRGQAAIRDKYAEIFTVDMKDFRRTAYAQHDDVLYIAWTGTKAGVPLAGADTFVIRDGKITAHTVFIVGDSTG